MKKNLLLNICSYCLIVSIFLKRSTARLPPQVLSLISIICATPILHVHIPPPLESCVFPTHSHFMISDSFTSLIAANQGEHERKRRRKEGRDKEREGRDGGKGTHKEQGHGGGGDGNDHSLHILVPTPIHLLVCGTCTNFARLNGEIEYLQMNEQRILLRSA